MALSLIESETLTRLASRLRRDSNRLTYLGEYYDGVQHLEQLGLAIPEDLRRFIVMVNWPRITADSLEERLDLEGFRLPGTLERDAEAWRLWQANGLDEESQLAHLDTLVYGRAYICVGSNPADTATPIITVESPLEMTHEMDMVTRRPRVAMRLYRDHDPVTSNVIDRATLYFPDVTVWAEKRWDGRGWTETDRDDHNLGRVPVVPLVNRPRTGDRYGVSELQDVIQLTDAAARALTLAQLATEALSVPQRVVLGASEKDFVDENGRTVSKWESYFGAVWALENENAKVQTFSAAALENFETIVNHYASQVSSVTGLPLRFFGQNTANPPSAEGIRADEARTIKRAERRQRAWGGSWEDAMRIAMLIATGEWDPDYLSLEAIWRDPATPTKAQAADATVKLVAAGILPITAAWEDLGYSPARIAALESMREKELASTDVLARQISAFQNPQPPPDGGTATSQLPVA